jgi:hypothetical protein
MVMDRDTKKIWHIQYSINSFYTPKYFEIMYNFAP